MYSSDILVHTVMANVLVKKMEWDFHELNNTVVVFCYKGEQSNTLNNEFQLRFGYNIYIYIYKYI